MMPVSHHILIVISSPDTDHMLVFCVSLRSNKNVKCIPFLICAPTFSLIVKCKFYTVHIYVCELAGFFLTTLLPLSAIAVILVLPV